MIDSLTAHQIDYIAHVDQSMSIMLSQQIFGAFNYAPEMAVQLQIRVSVILQIRAI